MATISFYASNCSYIAHANFTGTDPYPNGIPCPIYNVANITGTVRIYASEVSFPSGYGLPADVYVNGEYVDYLQSSSVSFSSTGVSYVNVIASKTSTTTKYKITLTPSTGVSSVTCYYYYDGVYTGPKTFTTSMSIYADYGTNVYVSAVTLESSQYEDPMLSDGSKSWYWAGDKNIYVSGNRSITFTASRKTYTISYNANGGSGAPSSQSFIAGTSVTLSSTVPTRDGYIFLGWSTSSTATSAMYSAGSIVTFGTSTILYAVWEVSEKTYYGRFTLNANGGAFLGTGYTSISWPTTGAMSGTGTSGAYVSTTLPVSGGNYVPTRSGYAFVGWATTSTATTANYYSGDTVGFTATSTSSSSPTTVILYAVWKQTFTLSFETSYSGVTNMPSDVTGITSGTGVTIPSVTPVLEGYTFLGWSKTDGGSATLFAGSTVYVTADTTLWAVFEKILIDLFYWNGSDTADATLIAKGQPVTNITAARWNLLLAKIKELADACGASFSYTTVSSGDGITAARFNAARTGLANIKTALGASTTLPAAQSSGNTVYATLFNGTASIKGALNALIEVYNDG